MAQNWQALADAVKERRRELGMTQPDMVEKSRRLDREHHPDNPSKKGLSVRTWSEIERAIEKERRGRTQHLVDLTLDWQPGTAHRLLTGKEAAAVPDDECAAAAELRRDLIDLRSEFVRLRAEVAEARSETARLRAGFAALGA